MLATIDPSPVLDSLNSGLSVGLIVAFAVFAAIVGAVLLRRLLGV